MDLIRIANLNNQINLKNKHVFSSHFGLDKVYFKVKVKPNPVIKFSLDSGHRTTC